jgi:hypothetical protein
MYGGPVTDRRIGGHLSAAAIPSRSTEHAAGCKYFRKRSQASVVAPEEHVIRVEKAMDIDLNNKESGSAHARHS